MKASEDDGDLCKETEHQFGTNGNFLVGNVPCYVMMVHSIPSLIPSFNFSSSTHATPSFSLVSTTVHLILNTPPSNVHNRRFRGLPHSSAEVGESSKVV